MSRHERDGSPPERKKLKGSLPVVDLPATEEGQSATGSTEQVDARKLIIEVNLIREMSKRAKRSTTIKHRRGRGR